MASLGHIAVGMAAGRLRHKGQPATLLRLVGSMAGWSALSMLPDADVLGFKLGIRYADEWGHRGATHSLLFAFLVALAIALGALIFRVRAADALRFAVGTFAYAWIVVSSHALLDTLTDGGLGCALFWPWSNARHFAPWNPIPVAPIGLRFFSAGGLAVASTEVLLFLPLFGYALWPRKQYPV